MEEALESLQAEREAKYALKKDLDTRLNQESMYNLSNLAAMSMNLSGEPLFFLFHLAFKVRILRKVYLLENLN